MKLLYVLQHSILLVGWLVDSEKPIAASICPVGTWKPAPVVASVMPISSKKLKATIFTRRVPVNETRDWHQTPSIISARITTAVAITQNSFPILPKLRLSRMARSREMVRGRGLNNGFGDNAHSAYWHGEEPGVPVEGMVRC